MTALARIENPIVDRIQKTIGGIEGVVAAAKAEMADIDRRLKIVEASWAEDAAFASAPKPREVKS
jgi:hypothetical protein